MAFMFQGATELIEENREREQKKQDRLLSIRTSALESYLTNRSKLNTNSALVSAKLRNIAKFLPEDSPIIDELAGADIKTITALEKEIIANRKFYSENNLTHTPEMLEDELDVVRVELDNNPDLNIADLYKDMFKLTEEDLSSEAGGVTLKEMLESYETSDIGVTYRLDPPPGLDDPGKLKEFTSAYQAELKPFINAKIKENEKEISDQGPNMVAAQQENERLEEALEALKGDFPDYYAAMEFVGPEPAIQLMETFPSYRNFSKFINKGLNFPDNVEGRKLLVRAIKSGLLQLGDKFMIGNNPEILTEDQVNSALGN